MIYEKVVNNLINESRVNLKMSKKDMIFEIHRETKKLCGERKTNYLIKVDEYYISNLISEIKKRLKNGVENR